MRPDPEALRAAREVLDRRVQLNQRTALGFADREACEALRVALAEVDHLTNVLLVECGAGVPPSPEWQWDHSTAWILRREDNWHACVEFRSNGWTVSLRSEFWNVRSNHATAYEAMEAANAALGSK